MEQQVLLDKLSEFLMVEQAGAQLYTVAAERTHREDLREQYLEFGKETEHHREVLIRLIEQLGGDPNYVSPMARVAQIRGQQMLCVPIQADGLSAEELDMIDLESVSLAETKDHADWAFLAELVDQIEDEAVRGPLQEAVDEVGTEEEEHLRWALDTLADMSMKMAMDGPAPPPSRWQEAWAGPHYAEDGHPAPITPDDGLLKPAQQESWDKALAVRAAATSGKKR